MRALFKETAINEGLPANRPQGSVRQYYPSTPSTPQEWLHNTQNTSECYRYKPGESTKIIRKEKGTRRNLNQAITQTGPKKHQHAKN